MAGHARRVSKRVHYENANIRSISKRRHLVVPPFFIHMIKLFLSHASEDKDDFVRPLAERLRLDFEVWYDEYELLLGDSLLGKIDQGLKNCDYGIVILSRHFFMKRWPQSELDGLFSLETTERKIILPIWKDIDADEVSRFSPILAARFAVSTNAGIPKVVEEIKKAVSFAGRYKFLEETAWKEKLLILDKNRAHRKKVEQIFGTEKGVEQVRKSAQDIISNARLRTEDLIKELTTIGLRIEDSSGRRDVDSLTIYGPQIIFLHFNFHCSYSNAADHARFSIIIGKGSSRYSQEKPKILEKFEFIPDLDQDMKVLWRVEKQAFLGSSILDFAFDKFVSKIC
jgi:hypothetical protein